MSNRWRLDRPQAEHGTRRVATAAGGDVEPVVVAQRDLAQDAGRARRRRPARTVADVVAVVADAEPEVEPVGLVAEVEQEVPHGQAVLAAGHGDEDPLPRRQHGVVVDGLGHLVAAELDQVLARRSWRCAAAGR